jgi:hypothetical protein
MATPSKELVANKGTGLYTDESPGLKVDPVVVLVLSLVFIFSVVALHGTFTPIPLGAGFGNLRRRPILKTGANGVSSTVIAKFTRRFSS